jgi:hypothetical protein
MHVEDLPSYACERLYMLSEIQLHAHDTFFLQDDMPSLSSSSEDSTQGTEDESVESLLNEEPPLYNMVSSKSMDTLSSTSTTHSWTETTTTSNATKDTTELSYILYLLWTPDMTSHVASYAESVLIPALHKLQHRIQPSSYASSCCLQGYFDHESSERSLPSPPSSPTSVASYSSSSSLSSSLPLDRTFQNPSIYIVVDRIAPWDETSSAEHLQHPFGKNQDTHTGSHTTIVSRECHWNMQVQLAQDLARHVASHSELRHACQGITVGVSNQSKAAPGLETCIQALQTGSSDRRHVSSRHTSQLVIVGTHDEELLHGYIPTHNSTDISHHHHHHHHHTSWPLNQARVVAEWSGQGTLHTLAMRTHGVFRRNYIRGACDASLLGPMRKKPCRSRQRGGGEGIGAVCSHMVRVVLSHATQDESASDRRLRASVLDAAMYSLLLGYLVFHGHSLLFDHA